MDLHITETAMNKVIYKNMCVCACFLDKKLYRTKQDKFYENI